MKDTEKLKENGEDLVRKIRKLAEDHSKLERKIAEWILWRKVEAGAITANGLEQLDKATHACSVVQQVVEDIKKITVLLAEATRLPKIAELICSEHGEKYDKQILRELENADAVSKSAVIFLLQVKDLILDADLKLKSTGWLSDRPPQIREVDLGKFEAHQAEVEKQSRFEKTITLNKIPEETVQNPKPEVIKELVVSAESEMPENSLRIARSQLKQLQNTMTQRRESVRTSDEEKTKQYRIDSAELEELNMKIQELVNKAEERPTPKTAAKATLRNNPVDNAIPKKISVSANF